MLEEIFHPAKFDLRDFFHISKHRLLIGLILHMPHAAVTSHPIYSSPQLELNP